MSYVNNVILTCGLGEDRAVGELNAFLNEEGRSFGNLRDVRSAAGGNKSVEAGVFVGAFNALIIDEFLEWVSVCSWRDPQSVRVFVQEQHDSAFSERYPAKLQGKWVVHIS